MEANPASEPAGLRRRQAIKLHHASRRPLGAELVERCGAGAGHGAIIGCRRQLCAQHVKKTQAVAARTRVAARIKRSSCGPVSDNGQTTRGLQTGRLNDRVCRD
jgi:hypothetical protein